MTVRWCSNMVQFPSRSDLHRESEFGFTDLKPVNPIHGAFTNYKIKKLRGDEGTRREAGGLRRRAVDIFTILRARGYFGGGKRKGWNRKLWSPPW
jgi:hypothetical protein